ncbi:Hypothetical predicted protein [Marmota monax]|uniref:Uncharacterized protein n=1 Tax=Marmota monax TaxID=9995 RepID=A0A5E4CXM0_MARMO|nr:hypothetical protein GHT09_011070 [Marmota monax]VTJ85899.1 Hypothetical predicted protein [Marmota monax]
MAGHSIQRGSRPQQILNHFFFFLQSLSSKNHLLEPKQAGMSVELGGTPAELRRNSGETPETPANSSSATLKTLAASPPQNSLQGVYIALGPMLLVQTYAN